MEVVNLGSFGPRRKSSASGLVDALATGSNIRHQRETEAINREELGVKKEQVKNQQEENNLRRNQYALELAKLNTQKVKDDTEMGYKLVKDVSARMLTMDESMRGVFEQSPEYKEISKVVKKYAPDFIAEDGRVMLLGKEDLIKDEMERRKNQIEEKITRGGLESLTPGEKDFITYQKNVGTEALAKVFAAAQDDPRFMKAQAAGDKNIMGQIVAEYTQDIFKGAEGPLASALSRPADRQPAADPNDPLGLRSK